MSNDKSKAPGRAKAFHEAIPLSLPKPVDGNKIQARTQRTNEPVHDYFNKLEIAFKENSGCLLDTESTRAAVPTLLAPGTVLGKTIFLWGGGEGRWFRR